MNNHGLRIISTILSEKTRIGDSTITISINPSEAKDLVALIEDHLKREVAKPAQLVSTATSPVRQGGEGQVGGDHYRGRVDPWELSKHMDTTGDVFLDFARVSAIKYIHRIKGDHAKRIEDYEKARHYVQAMIDHLKSWQKSLESAVVNHLVDHLNQPAKQ